MKDLKLFLNPFVLEFNFASHLFSFTPVFCTSEVREAAPMPALVRFAAPNPAAIKDVAGDYHYIDFS